MVAEELLPAPRLPLPPGAGAGTRAPHRDHAPYQDAAGQRWPLPAQGWARAFSQHRARQMRFVDLWAAVAPAKRRCPRLAADFCSPRGTCDHTTAPSAVRLRRCFQRDVQVPGAGDAGTCVVTEPSHAQMGPDTYMHLGSAASQQVDQSCVKGHDGVPHVDSVVLLLLRLTFTDYSNEIKSKANRRIKWHCGFATRFSEQREHAVIHSASSDAFVYVCNLQQSNNGLKTRSEALSPRTRVWEL